MPAIASSATVSPKVLVTGANGYLAIWIVRKLLEKGYSVRGAVRSADKGQYLQELFKSYGDKLELVMIPDITADGAFDEAVKGIDSIEHVASPLPSSETDPRAFVDPAVKGTVGILKSALNVPTIKRIVITSSTAAIDMSNFEGTFTEADWNEESIRIMEEKGHTGGVMHLYSASKTLAEKAAWVFYDKHKGHITWDLSVLNPSYIFGPPINDVTSLATISGSMSLFWNNVGTKEPKSPEMFEYSSSWVDVRDVADAHVLSLEKEAAGGKRLIVSAGQFTWKEWVDIVKGEHNPGSYVYWSKFDNSKAGNVLGLHYRSKEETATDIFDDFSARGWN